MTPNRFRTIAEPGDAQTRVLGSRFLGTAVKVNNAVETARFIEEAKRRYHDATHWCFAVRHGVGNEQVEKSSDAGEPRGTAGVPILREIQNRDLTNCLVVVTRYFGGTKLGTGNLARAYAECAALALDTAGWVEEEITSRIHIECDYDDQSIVYHVARRFRAVVEPCSSSMRVCLLLHLPPDAVPAATAALQEESRGRILVREP
ncbi:IMPACT family protein [bacterium]|nr:IMPACT family protein [bacterium]MBU1984239.1 IMPACT family protein [bacterium]